MAYEYNTFYNIFFLPQDMVLILILENMNTHNICLYWEMEKIIPDFLPNTTP